jgi:Polysaccharide lyase
MVVRAVLVEWKTVPLAGYRWFVMALIMLAYASSYAATFTETWDDGNGLSRWTVETCPPISDHFAIVTDPTKPGNKVLRVYNDLSPCRGGLRTAGTPRARHELRRPNPRIIPYGQDFWARLRIYVPPNWPTGALPVPFMTIQQVILADGATHGTDYKLRIERNNHWGFEGLSTQGMHGGRKDLGPIVPGRWVEWVIHLKRSYESDGVLQVWKDSQLVWDKRGRTTWTERREHNTAWWKFGMYASAGTVDRAYVLFFDDIQLSSEPRAPDSGTPPPRKHP